MVFNQKIPKKKNRFVLAQWEEKHYKIKHEGVYPISDKKAIEEKLKTMKEKNQISKFKITPQENFI
jgi:hypothetical protein